MIETIRKCDVYGTKRDVRAVRVRVEAETDDGEWVLFTGGLYVADQGPRAVKRLMHSITRALHPPGWSLEDNEAAALEAERAAEEAAAP